MSHRALEQVRATLQRLPLPKDDKFDDLLDQLAARENDCAAHGIATRDPNFILADALS